MRKRPGEVRDAIVTVLKTRPRGASVAEITHHVQTLIGTVPAASIRTYFTVTTPKLFPRVECDTNPAKGTG